MTSNGIASPESPEGYRRWFAIPKSFAERILALSAFLRGFYSRSHIVSPYLRGIYVKSPKKTTSNQTVACLSLAEYTRFVSRWTLEPGCSAGFVDGPRNRLQKSHAKAEAVSTTFYFSQELPSVFDSVFSVQCFVDGAARSPESFHSYRKLVESPTMSRTSWPDAAT